VYQLEKEPLIAKSSEETVWFMLSTRKTPNTNKDRDEIL